MTPEEFKGEMSKLTDEVCYYVISSETGTPSGKLWELCIVRANASGYYKLDYPPVKTEKEAWLWADELNTRMGISHDKALVIVTSSMRVSPRMGRHSIHRGRT